MANDKNGKNTEDEDGLWAEITKDVKQIEQDKPLSEEVDKPAKKTRTPVNPPKNTVKAASKYPKNAPAAPARGPENPNAGIDRNTAERLRRGQLPVEARLDLHGMNREKAQQALLGFIHRQYVAGKRCVLVITGKGPGKDGRRDPLNEGFGVLKQSVPQWLAEPPNRSLVLKTATAKPKDGGEGALYVLLRRKR